MITYGTRVDKHDLVITWQPSSYHKGNRFNYRWLRVNGKVVGRVIQHYNYECGWSYIGDDRVLLTGYSMPYLAELIADYYQGKLKT